VNRRFPTPLKEGTLEEGEKLRRASALLYRKRERRKGGGIQHSYSTKKKKAATCLSPLTPTERRERGREGKNVGLDTLLSNVLKRKPKPVTHNDIFPRVGKRGGE